MYDLGDTVPLSITVKDEDGAPTNASSVLLTITNRDGTVVPDTTPTSPGAGQYRFDFVPTVAGIYDVLWRSTGPAAAFDDIIDVRAPARGVVSLTDARTYLQKLNLGAVDEDELRSQLAAAQLRVDRHLGRALADADAVTETEVLAVKVVLAEYWRNYRTKFANRGAGMGSTAAAIDTDNGPSGLASLTARLTDLLGPPVGAGAGGVPSPMGSFPEPCGWPDPAPRIVAGPVTW